MNCPQCGTENPEDARFCMSCGTALVAEVPAPPEEPPPTEEVARPAPPEELGVTEGITPVERIEPTAPLGAPEAEEILPVEEAAPVPPAPPRPAGPVAPVLTAGWGAALVRGVVAFLVMGLLAELIAVLLFANGGLPATQLAKAGGIIFYAFHHVGVEADFPPFDFSRIFGGLGEGVPDIPGVAPIGPIDVSITAALALMLATALLAWLLYRGGRSVAARAGGRPWARAVHGVKVAAPYALLSFGLSFLISFEVPVPAGVPFLVGGGEFSVRLSPVAALLWPLALGVVFGGLGGLSTARAELARERRGRLGVAVLGGGLRMAGYGLGLAFLGLLVHAAVSPDVTRAYFDAVIDAGPQEGAAQIVFTALVVPNMATLVLVPAMGGSLAATGAGTTLTLLSYTDFPTGIDPGFASQLTDPFGAGLGTAPASPIDSGPAPVGYFLFLLVPLAATVLAGVRTSRRHGAASAGQGALIGLGSGVVFAVAVVALSVLAGFSFTVDTAVSGLSQTMRSFIGPHLALAAALALAWGLLGGALGGALGARQRERRPPVAPAGGVHTGFEVEPPPPRPEMMGGPPG